MLNQLKMLYRGISDHLGEIGVVFGEGGCIICAVEELIEFSLGVSVVQILRHGL
jgi:hypothetical protein